MGFYLTDDSHARLDIRGAWGSKLTIQEVENYLVTEYFTRCAAEGVTPDLDQFRYPQSPASLTQNP